MRTDILWLLPGMGRNKPASTFLSLFRSYDIVCRAKHKCDAQMPVNGGVQTVTFKAGDAIAATAKDGEDELIRLLKERGIEESMVSFGPGGRGSQYSRTNPA